MVVLQTEKNPVCKCGDVFSYAQNKLVEAYSLTTFQSCNENEENLLYRASSTFKVNSIHNDNYPGFGAIILFSPKEKIPNSLISLETWGGFG